MTFPTKYLILICILSPPTLALETHHLAKGDKKITKTSPGRNGPSSRLTVQHVSCGPGSHVVRLAGRKGLGTGQLLWEFNIICPPIKLTVEVQ